MFYCNCEDRRRLGLGLRLVLALHLAGSRLLAGPDLRHSHYKLMRSSVCPEKKGAGGKERGEGMCLRGPCSTAVNINHMLAGRG